MTSAANQYAYGPRDGNQGPWGNSQGSRWQTNNGSGSSNPNLDNPTWSNQGGNQAWVGPPFWHPAGMSRPVAIAFTVLGFIFWWPVGLAMLFYMIGSGRMGCFGRRRRAMNQQNWQDAGPWGTWRSWACGPTVRLPPPGTVHLMNTRRRPSVGWRKSRRSSDRSLSVCALPKTRRSLISSWPTAALGRPTLRRPNSQRFKDVVFRPRAP